MKDQIGLNAPALTPEEIKAKAEKKAEKKADKKKKKEIQNKRLFVAFQRTLLSWVRTSTNLFTFGFAIWKLLEQYSHEPGDHPMLKTVSPKTIGLIMISAAFIGLFMAVIAYVKIANKFGQSPKATYTDPAMIQSYVILSLCGLTMAGVVLNLLFR